MNIGFNNLFRYLCTSSLLGVGSAVFGDLFWMSLTGGVHIIDATLKEPIVFLTCWYFGGAFSWVLCKSRKYLALTTYLFSYLIFIIMSMIYGDFNDPSVKGWYYLCIIGYGFLCLPAYFVNRVYIIPKLF